jgi:chaperonin GroES
LELETQWRRLIQVNAGRQGFVRMIGGNACVITWRILGKGAAMKFRPLHDRVVIRRIEGETRSVGGVIIPDTAKEKPQQGDVVAVGPGRRGKDGVLQPLDVKAGDRVLFGKWSGSEVRIADVEYLIMSESDLLGVFEVDR